MTGGMRSALFFLGVLICGLTQFTMSWEDDTKCLRKFKNSVTDPSNYLANWDFKNASRGYVCSFVGVQCWNTDENKVLSLKLERAGLSGHFPLGLQACSSLVALSLAGNHFTGPLPLDVCKQMPYLTVLDLSFNQFEGSIPSDLPNCVYLNTLHLQKNHLSGQIPWELGLLPQLVDLDLSSNALSGRIPSSFTNRAPSPFGPLNFTNRSMVHAPGPFGASTFTNNPLLCGLPLASECSPAQSHRNWIVGGSLVGVLILILAVVLTFLRILQQANYTPHRSNHNGDTPSLPIMCETHLKLTWEELQHATATFSPANIVGKGGSSTVYKGRLLNGRKIAVKLLHNDELGFLRTPTQLFETELDVLGKLRHRNLVKILGYFYNLESMAIIMDYMPAGSLDTLLRRAGNDARFGWELRLGILLGIAEGLSYLHHEYDGKESIIHADLKPGNVLLDENMEAHIADFGIAAFASTISTSNSKGLSKAQVLPARCWSLGYTAPECVQQGVVSRKGDVFSFGVIVLEVITGERPSSDKLKEGESLVEWVSKAVTEGMMEQVVAPVLLQRPNELALRWREDISATLRMGCCCASLTRASRPDMSTVVTFMRQLNVCVPVLLNKGDEIVISG